MLGCKMSRGVLHHQHRIVTTLKPHTLHAIGLKQARSLVCRAKTLYDLLEVSSSASSDDIHVAYRQLARKYHPDVNKEPDAPQIFIQLKLAYETLAEPNLRAEYDGAINGMAARRTNRSKAKAWWNRSRTAAPSQPQAPQPPRTTSHTPHGDDYVPNGGSVNNPAAARPEPQYATAGARQDSHAGASSSQGGTQRASAPRRPAWARAATEESPMEVAAKKLRTQINGWTRETETNLEQWTATLTQRSDYVDKSVHELGAQVCGWIAEVAREAEAYAAVPPGDARTAARAAFIVLLEARSKNVAAACQDAEQKLQWLGAEAQATATSVDQQLSGWSTSLREQCAELEAGGMKVGDMVWRWQEENAHWLQKVHQRLAYWDTVANSASREIGTQLSCWYLNRRNWLAVLDVTEEQLPAAGEQPPAAAATEQVPPVPQHPDAPGPPQAVATAAAGSAPQAAAAADSAPQVAAEADSAPQAAAAAAAVPPPLKDAPAVIRGPSVGAIVLLPHMETRIVPVFSEKRDWVRALEEEEEGAEASMDAPGADRNMLHGDSHYQVRMLAHDGDGLGQDPEAPGFCPNKSSVALYAMLCFLTGSAMQKVEVHSYQVQTVAA